ncbi:MAG: hypothetical protein R3250_02780 [Melioribacteraceae bacterium]|nr:hypothetical protein [Melioribacteraceae bacterium]
MKDLIFRVVRLFLIWFILLSTNISQTLNLQSLPSDKSQIGLTFDKVFYSNGNNYSLLTGVFQLSTNIPVSDNLNVIANIPFINMSYENDYAFGTYEFSENGFGNLFIGLQTNSEFTDNSRTVLSFGIFLPTSEEKISNVGSQVNFYDFQKYIPNSLGLYFNFASQKIFLNGFNFGFEVGPNVIIPTEGEGRDTELFLHYGLNLGYQIVKLAINAEFLGTGIITEKADNFEDRLIHQLNFGAQWIGRIVTPKLYYGIYLKEEFRNVIDGVLGFDISISLN